MASISSSATAAAENLPVAKGRDLSRNKPSVRARWIKLLHTWHWVSSAICLAGLFLFAVTGITLNHAGEIEASPRSFSRNVPLPQSFRQLLAETPADSEQGPLPQELRLWLSQQLEIDLPRTDAEWSGHEIYLAMPRPGGDAWIRIDRETGVADYERTDRGWVAYLNDLHKGRHTGAVWSWFIDIFSLACMVFAITGLVLLYMHGRGRPMTWPVVGFGLLIPVFLMLVFVH